MLLKKRKRRKKRKKINKINKLRICFFTPNIKSKISNLKHQIVTMENAIIKSDFNFPGQKNVYKGKVRDVYTLENDILVMVASDRISAFDHILPKGIPHKGQVLNQVATMFLDATKDIVPNWLIGTPDPSVAVGYACEPVRVEMVIRGYLAGHSAR